MFRDEQKNKKAEWPLLRELHSLNSQAILQGNYKLARALDKEIIAIQKMGARGDR